MPMENTQLDMFSFFEMTPDLVCIATKDGFFRKVNKAALDKLEFTEAELFSRPISSFQHHEDREITARTRDELLAGTALVNFENRYITKTGKILWLHWTSIYVPDKEVVFAIAKDITVKKKIELETEENYQKFKGLATHFKTSLEKDRKTFAVELREELAQLAAAIKMDVGIVRNGLPELAGFLKNRIDNAFDVSQLLIDKLRKISFTISPYMLGQLGLSETLQWLCEEFTTLNDIPCNFTGSYNEENITHEIKLDFFRICQESLSNIMQHANAKSVDINIADSGEEICLSIADNGAGFKMDEVQKKSGFTNMRELATSINGGLEIRSDVGKGTTICFTVAKLSSANNLANAV